ncbi:MAG: DEAD/DEAH box helicase [Candidatus Aminicenantes bacterium]|nr:DEAD/DEAH box helicase [Candidatus Aminicenantes bacterium]
MNIHAKSAAAEPGNRPLPKGHPGGHSTPQPSAKADNGVFSTLLPELRKAVAEEGYGTPTPIQTQAIPHLLENRDLIGCAQTGTGKTAAFILPILQYLYLNKRQAGRGRARVLILAPTRELAAQIGSSAATYGRHLRFTHAVIFGGVSQLPQVQALNRGLDILVATPGRLLDLMQQGVVSLDTIEIFVLDEADRMLDMGFFPDIKKVIAKLPAKRQSLFFSATMEPAVVALARTLVHDAVHVTIAHEAPAVERIVQRVMFVDKNNKDALLAALLSDARWDRVIVFTQMKHMANKVVKKLAGARISAVAIHGNKSQGARTEALASFKDVRIRVLVATDIAARGLDVDGISHVINYDLPVEPEVYIHRIGRTARAGAGGDAVSFCSAGERDSLRAIEKLIRAGVPVDTSHAFHSETASRATGTDARPAPKAARNGNGGNGSRNQRNCPRPSAGPARRSYFAQSRSIYR